MEFAESFRAAVEGAMVARSGPADYWRAHLGMSQIGTSCERKLFYDYYWYSHDFIGARKRRLLERGHDEEERFVRYLRDARIRVFGRQTYYKSLVPGFGGSIDGYIKMSAIKKHLPEHLLPPIPLTSLVGIDFKTANNSNFNKVKADGVFAAFPQYFAQAQSYMHASREPQSPTAPLAFFLFMIVNKNNDEWFFESVPYYSSYGYALVETAKEILAAQSALELPRISESPMWWECKQLCKNSEVCHFGSSPAANCRTCDHSQNSGMVFRCSKSNAVLTVEEQRVGCSEYERGTQRQNLRTIL
tara:strand:- start:4179 stop:5084 length:906 start_codon:yes stop_codon:yes gene_type:complete